MTPLSADDCPQGHTAYPSRHAIGDHVLFQPDLSRLGDAAASVPAQVTAVSFTNTKVLYDLAVRDPDGGFYDALPLRAVDSCMVLPRDAQPSEVALPMDAALDLAVSHIKAVVALDLAAAYGMGPDRQMVGSVFVEALWTPLRERLAGDDRLVDCAALIVSLANRVVIDRLTLTPLAVRGFTRFLAVVPDDIDDAQRAEISATLTSVRRAARGSRTPTGLLIRVTP